MSHVTDRSATAEATAGSAAADGSVVRALLEAGCHPERSTLDGVGPLARAVAHQLRGGSRG